MSFREEVQARDILAMLSGPYYLGYVEIRCLSETVQKVAAVPRLQARLTALLGGPSPPPKPAHYRWGVESRAESVLHVSYQPTCDILAGYHLAIVVTNWVHRHHLRNFATTSYKCSLTPALAGPGLGMRRQPCLFTTWISPLLEALKRPHPRFNPN